MSREKEGLSKDNLSSLLHHYDIGELTRFSPFSSGAGGVTYFVETTQGRFVARREDKTAHVTLDNLTDRLELLSFLSGHGFPVPRLVKNDSGDLITISDGIPYTIQEFVAGDCAIESNDISRGRLTEAAKLLALYHRLVVSEPHPNWIPNPGPAFDPDRLFRYETAVTLWRDVATILEQKSFLDGVDKTIMAIIPAKLEELNVIGGTVEDFNQAASKTLRLLGHGDFQATNLVFREDKIVAVLDWEYAKMLPRSWEVLRAACAMCRLEIGDIFNVPLDLGKMKLLLGNYHAVYPLAREELDLMPMMGYLMSLSPIFLLRRYYTKGDKEVRRFFPVDVDHWFWWFRNSEMLRDFFLSFLD